VKNYPLKLLKPKIAVYRELFLLTADILLISADPVYILISKQEVVLFIKRVSEPVKAASP
jgi:hypothetical protein